MSSRTPATQFLPVLCAVGATLLFAASSGLDSYLRALCFVGGLVLLVAALVGVARLRTSTPAGGWLPSKESGRTGAHEEPDGR